MSDENPLLAAEQPPRGSPPATTNRRQVLLYTFLTVVLTVATVWAGRILLANSETLTFAVGAPGSEEARFAAKLGDVMKSTRSRLRLKILSNTDNTKAVAQFDRREADVVILRTDSRVPPRARSVAILDHDLVLLLSPGSKKIKSLDDLKKIKKIAVWADGDPNIAFVRKAFDFPDTPDTAAKLQVAPAGSTLEKLFASGYGAVITVAHASRVMQDKGYEQLAKKGGFTLNAIEDAKALARKIPGITEETVEAGILSSSPEVPEDDVDSIGLEWLLVAQSRLSASSAVELARVVYENKAELGLDGGFASKIEPAETEKNAMVMAHPGAAEYINDDIKTFMDQYSDVMYLGAGALSVIGSIFAGLYAQITRVCPAKASGLATALLNVGEKIQDARTMDQLETVQDELERILRGVVVGLRDGTISNDGLETFKLGYEFVRGELEMRREYLKRHGDEVVHDDNVTVVKAARSA